MAQTPDVVIVGGGVIGLSIAWYLGRAGMSVRILERDRIGSHASGAAAGMLAPLAESDEVGPLFAFGKASLDLYPAFLEQLSFDSELDVLLEGPGLLRVAFDGKEADQLKALATTQSGIDLNAEWLDEVSMRDIQPGVADGVCGAVLSPREKHINPRRMIQALTRACQRQGVTFLEGMHAEKASQQTGGAHKTIYAAGAWTGELLATLGVAAPVIPVKGQVVLLRQPAKELRYTLFGKGGYVVPREDGTVLAGATSESAGFDERTTDAGTQQLKEIAFKLFPGSQEFSEEDAWASVRPGTSDGLPILGRLPMENAFVATGHFRNGILQAPITAKLIAELIVTDKDPEMLAPFSPSRFLKAGTN